MVILAAFDHLFKNITLKNYLFVFGCAGYSLLLCLSFPWLQCTGFSLQWLLFLQSTGSRPTGSVVVAHRLVAPRHVGFSQTGD